MSGPKISVYSLTGWAKRVVDGQMKCEQQALVCSKQILSILSQCSEMRRGLDQSLMTLEMLQRKSGGQESLIEEVRSLQNNMDREIKRIESELARNMPSISPKYRISEDALEAKKRDLERIVAIKNKAQALKDKLTKATNAGKEAGKGEQKKVQKTIAEYLCEGNDDKPSALEGRDLSEVESSISEGISGIFSFDEVDEPEEDTSFEDRKKAIRTELMELLKLQLSEALSDEIRNALSALDRITAMNNLTTFDSVTVKKVFRDLEEYQRECEKDQEEFDEESLRYQMLCDMAGKAAEKERKFATIEELYDAVHEMEIVVLRQKEQAYIADCVDEVMQDMGYDLIGRREVKKKSGKQFKNELYQFGEGTAVNVTYSPDGQISMEMGGIAREDRIPTADETSVLTQDMESFCGEFAEFEKRMKDKGVIVGNRIALMPPTAEYAAIINVSDYDVEQGKQIDSIDAYKKGIQYKEINKIYASVPAFITAV